MSTKRKPWPIEIERHDVKIAGRILPSDALRLLDGSGRTRTGTVEVRGFAPDVLASPSFWEPAAGLLTPGSRLAVSDFGTEAQPRLMWFRDVLVTAVGTDKDGFATGLQIEVLAAWDRPAEAKAKAA